ncbi:MAG TPA: Ig-like domain-containing protein, partial [Gemmatimonadaceae bacterium]|nr:Ig-like domain-containing protein [Gemmatimonadaceae bacterium]
MKNVRIRLVAVSIFFAALACAPEHRGNTFTEPPAPKGPSVLTTLGVSVPGTVIVGQSTTATVTGADQFGATIATGPVVWSTLSAAVATVNGNGVVTAVAPGQTQVVATATGLS